MEVCLVLANRCRCFGFDIIINSKLQPSLLEINVSPSLSAGTPLDRKIKNSLITDVFHTVGFCSFDTKKGMREIRKNSEARLFGKSEQSRVRNRFSLEQCSIDDLSIQEVSRVASPFFEIQSRGVLPNCFLFDQTNSLE